MAEKENIGKQKLSSDDELYKAKLSLKKKLIPEELLLLLLEKVGNARLGESD